MNRKAYRKGRNSHVIAAALMIVATGCITAGRVAVSSASRKPLPANLYLVQAQSEPNPSQPKPQAKATAKKLQVSVNAECDVMITKAQGKRLGFDAAKGEFINEIPLAEIREVPPFPIYLLPAEPADIPYTMRLTGRPSVPERRADVMITGSGFVAGCKNLLIAAGKTLTLKVSSDGRQLALTAGQGEQLPLLFTSTQSGRTNPSYSFEIGGVKLAAGKTLTLALDMEKQRLYFKDDDATRGNYTVKLRRTNPDGTKNLFLKSDFQVGKADNYMMDFGKWDGKTALCFYVDDKGDGFDNKECIRIEAQK